MHMRMQVFSCECAYIRIMIVGHRNFVHVHVKIMYVCMYVLQRVYTCVHVKIMHVCMFYVKFAMSAYIHTDDIHTHRLSMHNKNIHTHVCMYMHTCTSPQRISLVLLGPCCIKNQYDILVSESINTFILKNTCFVKNAVR